ncbi:hypothetical protein DFH07DRAFT_953462 [Mycena maculata]|uniref:malate dehydrogenase n=1 Tax=Mycena maculata TaxID=230809 RepID=A0AAD7JT04_9AGAR|nr:hypothetical protein DFH07DRAFT_953462 [Mycena maculata]
MARAVIGGEFHAGLAGLLLRRGAGDAPCVPSFDLQSTRSARKVSLYSVLLTLDQALEGAKVIVIVIPLVSRESPVSVHHLAVIVQTNASIVRDLAAAVARVALTACVLVISNRVNSTVPIVAATLEKAGVFASSVHCPPSRPCCVSRTRLAAANSRRALRVRLPLRRDVCGSCTIAFTRPISSHPRLRESELLSGIRGSVRSAEIKDTHLGTAVQANPYVRQFGMTLTITVDLTITPRDGAWNKVNKRLKPVQIDRWVVVIYEQRRFNEAAKNYVINGLPRRWYQDVPDSVHLLGDWENGQGRIADHGCRNANGPLWIPLRSDEEEGMFLQKAAHDSVYETDASDATDAKATSRERDFAHRTATSRSRHRCAPRPMLDSAANTPPSLSSPLRHDREGLDQQRSISTSRTPGGTHALERILYVWAIRDPYVQGMNGLGTPFL